MKTLHLALAAVYRLEVAETTSEWWDAQSDSFKDQYITDHPKSKFARAAREAKKGKPKHATNYDELFDSHFYDDKKPKADKEDPSKKTTTKKLPVVVKALDYAAEEFTKQASDAINRYLAVDTVDLTALHTKTLRVLDSAVHKKLEALARQKKQLRRQQAGLRNRLKKASTKEEKALLKKEIAKLDTSHNRLSKQEEILTGKHQALVDKHPKVLKTINTIRKQSKDRAAKKAQINILNKDIAKLKQTLVKVQKTFDAAADTGLRRQARVRLKEIKTDLAAKLKALKALNKV